MYHDSKTSRNTRHVTPDVSARPCTAMVTRRPSGVEIEIQPTDIYWLLLSTPEASMTTEGRDRTGK